MKHIAPLPAGAALSALAFLLATCAPPTPPERVLADNGFWEVQLQNGDITLQWQVDGDLLHIIESAPTNGWVAVGFDPSIWMKDANILIGYVDDTTGDATVRDDYGDTQTSHKPDVMGNGESNVSSVSGTQSGGRTELHLTIPLDTGDIRDQVLTEGETHKFLVAYGADDDLTQKHAWKTSFDMTL